MVKHVCDFCGGTGNRSDTNILPPVSFNPKDEKRKLISGDAGNGDRQENGGNTETAGKDGKPAGIEQKIDRRRKEYKKYKKY